MSARGRWRQEMPPVNALSPINQEDQQKFHMPIEPSDYPDRHLLLTEKEREGIAYLLSLSSGQYQEFGKQVEQLKRVVQPLLDVLALYQQWRPKSAVSRQHFLGYFLDQVLQTNTTYWEWEERTWRTVIDAVPTRPKEVQRRREPGYTTSQSPNFVLTRLAAYLFANVLHLQGKERFPCRALG